MFKPTRSTTSLTASGSCCSSYTRISLRPSSRNCITSRRPKGGKCSKSSGKREISILSCSNFSRFNLPYEPPTTGRPAVYSQATNPVELTWHTFVRDGQDVCELETGDLPS